MTKRTSHVGRSLAAAAATAVLCAGSAVVTAGTASAALVDNCGQMGWAICSEASVTELEKNTANCPGQGQYFLGDDSSTAIDWTYSNGNHPCVRVDFPIDDGTSCDFFFYVPNAHATTRHLVFGYWTSDGAKHYFPTVDENSTYGWKKLTTSQIDHVTRISFQDNDGEPGTQIGWGSQPLYGIGEACAFVS